MIISEKIKEIKNKRIGIGELDINNYLDSLLQFKVNGIHFEGCDINIFKDGNKCIIKHDLDINKLSFDYYKKENIVRELVAYHNYTAECAKNLLETILIKRFSVNDIHYNDGKTWDIYFIC